ncbi:MAG TPA: NAD(P)-dependent alcohol dehydrogenase [Steroidobacteraceae bacterium]|nr:NAD(P)-dependent alcohol dehydrogenase [Steroidobacteraceae bacterium]
MKLRHKILGAVGIVAAAGLVSLGLLVSHDSPCVPAPPVPAGATLMKAIVNRCYGSPDILTYENIARPVPGDNEILVRVHAASVNPLDWHYMEGTPYVLRLEAGLGKPDNPRLGVDFAGTVEAVGRSVTRFKPGDEVFGGKRGAFAEYVLVPADRAIALKPHNVTFGQAAAVPIAGITALQALRDKGHVQAGQKVLINGASGGVGTFAVQIAKALGAEVTGVCSTRNVDLVHSIGADHVIDYTREDVTTGADHYDVIVDNVSTHSLLGYRRILRPNGIYVMIGSATTGNWLGFLVKPVEGMVLSWFVSQKFGMMLAELDHQDLAELGTLMESGKLMPVIDRQYPLRDAPAALRYVEQGHARGKVVLTVDSSVEARANP